MDSINISTAKNEIKQIISMIQNLKQKYNYLENSIEIISQENFGNIFLEIKENQNILNSLLNKYENCEFQKELKKKMKKRIKKREKIVQKHQERQKQKNKLNENINKNLNTIREEFNKTLENEKFLKQTKNTLFKLKRKILTTKRYIENLKFLKKSQNDAQYTQELNLLEENLKEYHKEKQKLEEVLAFNSNSFEDQWRKILFGKKKRDRKVINRPELEKFFEIRQIWDSYIVPPTTNYGTSIPLGWVFPPQNPTKKWAEYLFENCP